MADGDSPSPRTPAVAPVETPSVPGLTMLAVGVVVVAALYFGREVLVPITLAVLLTFVLAPLVNGLRRLHLPRVPATILAVLLAFGVILAIIGALGTQLAQLGQDLPRYQATIHAKVNTVRDLTVGRLGGVLRDVGKEFQGGDRPAAGQPSAAPASPQSSEPKPTPVEIREPTPTPLDLAERLLSPIVGPLTTAGIIVIVTIFILMQREDLRDRLIRLFGSSDLHRTTIAMDDAARRLSKYFLTQLALNTSFGIMVGIGLFVIGVPSPALWAIAAALMRFVPYIGALLSAIMPIALAAAVDPGWSMVVWTAALFIVGDLIFGQVLEPLVYGHSTGLSPVAVVIAAIFWTWLWGSVGLLLSTPLTLCAVVLGRHIKRLEFLDVLLGDRPALTPVESYYQRMLAGDADEVSAYAEVLLKDRSLSSYYDEVALKGLQLAAADEARGVLTATQVTRITEAVEDLVTDLDDYDDVEPEGQTADDGPAVLPARERTLRRKPAVEGQVEPAEIAGTVLCLAGRGALDGCAAQILAQLLRKHGLVARIVPHAATSRASLPSLEIGPVIAVCVCDLDLNGTPSHLRYLLRRLRQRWPEALLLAGFWPDDDLVPLPGEEGRHSLGADAIVASLRDAVAACLEAVLAGQDAAAAHPRATAGAFDEVSAPA